jgi:transcriptional regulator with XRE-family HTH domain
MQAYSELIDKKAISSKKDFCETVGLSYSNWSKYVRGERPVDLENIVKLKEVYGVNADYILFGESNLAFVDIKKPSHAPSSDSVKNEIVLLKRELELLKTQLQDKERIIQLLELQLKK